MDLGLRFTKINWIFERFVDSNILGDMDTIMSSIMLVRYDEEVRIREIIDDLIAKKEVKKFKAFTQVRYWYFQPLFRKISSTKVD